MGNIYFGDFRKYVIEHYKAIQAKEPDYQSTEWYLLRYLKRIEKNTNPPTSTGRVESSMRGFIRFYVDRVDDKSELGDRCLKIYAEYRRVLRSEQEKT